MFKVEWFGRAKYGLKVVKGVVEFIINNWPQYAKGYLRLNQFRNLPILQSSDGSLLY